MARPGSRRVDIVVDPPVPDRHVGSVRDVRTGEVIYLLRGTRDGFIAPMSVEFRGRDGTLIECAEADLLDALRRCGVIREHG